MTVEQPDQLNVICCDVGTTNARAWLIADGRVVASAHNLIGARDVAQSGSSRSLRTALRHLIAEVREINQTFQPSAVIGAGMLTSPLGLIEVPHLSAPTGSDELAANLAVHQFSDITDLPFYLVPGIKTVSSERGSEAGGGVCDVMRGEESLCIGLLAQKTIAPDSVMLNLGSHWKAIILRDNRITGSFTLLSGEMIYAAQTQTILAAALSRERPAKLELEWCTAGLAEQQRTGLMRALFRVRLLQIGGNTTTATSRWSYLIGAFIGDALQSLEKTAILTNSETPIAIVGTPALAHAWKNALTSRSFNAVALTPDQTERGIIGGLCEILKKHERPG